MPRKFLSFLRKDTFPTVHNMQLESDEGTASNHFISTRKPHFLVPSSEYPLINWDVELKFLGEDGKSVTVTCPAEPFIASYNPKEGSRKMQEGLFYEHPSDVENSDFGIFGTVSRY